MTTSDINSSLIGKKVKGIFTAMEVTGIIDRIIDDKYSAGVHIVLDKPVQWGEFWYKDYESTSRKHDEFGNLKYTKLI